MRRVLLTPVLLTAKNRFFPPGSSPWRALAIALCCVLACGALHLVSLKVLGYFHAQNELGIILSLKLFSMAWILMFAMHIFSCMVSAVSELFLALEYEIVFAAPVKPGEIFFMRYVSLFAQTSWMTVLFSFPVYAAFGRAFDAGPAYWPLMAGSIVMVAAIAVGTGLVATIILIRLFPARRTRDIIFYLSLCFAVFIFLIFRMIRPELLANPDQFASFIDYLSAVSAPSGPYVPGAWAANMLSAYLLDRTVDPLLCGLLATTPFSLFFLGEWAMDRLFFNGYSKSQESFGGYRRFGRRRIPRRGRLRWLAAKELKALLRDSAEWSQLFMVAALVVVYLYNFKVLPLDRSFWEEEYLTNLIAFLNIGLTGFVTTSLAARFILPSIGAEGGCFYLIQSSPLSIHAYLRHKLAIYALPFTGMAVLLVAVAAHLLNIDGPLVYISIVSTVIITLTVIALALYFGAVFADFKAANKTAAQGGIGAILFLLTALFYQGLVLGGGAYPVYRITAGWIRGQGVTAMDALLALCWLAVSCAISVLIVVTALRKGAARLQYG